MLPGFLHQREEVSALLLWERGGFGLPTSLTSHSSLSLEEDREQSLRPVFELLGIFLN